MDARALFSPSAGFRMHRTMHPNEHRIPSFLIRTCQACWVLCEIGGKPFSPVMVCHLSAKLRHKMLQRLRSREKRVHGADWLEIDEPMLEYVVNQAS